jgi:hypothetical protein
MADLATYTDLLPSYHAEQPNFLATLGAALQPLVDIQGALLAMPTDYDVDAAFGGQLDVIGAWVGASRRIVVPITGVYFSNDVVAVGLDEGVWYRNDDPSVAISTLDDETYRLLLKMKIAANKFDGTLDGAQAVFDSIADVGATVTIHDHFDMTFSVRVAGESPSVLFMDVIRLAAEWVRPAGVGIVQVVRV